MRLLVWPVDGSEATFYVPAMLVLFLKVLVAIGSGFAITALL
ncbi:MAG TPA: hypothetical protein VIT21_04300 [Chthoniobacterales bacterium]